jgi:RNA polymerase sigma-70 factor (ECF subfamily)
MFLRRRTTDTATDEELASRSARGDAAALAVLWDRYAHLLFGVSMKYLKDPDAAKDQVAALFGQLPALLDTHHVERFAPWVHRVTRNACLQVLRKQHPAAPLPETLEDTGGDALEEKALREAALDRLDEAIASLREPQRSCIRLFHLQRLSYQRVAEALGLSVPDVRSHLQNGRRNLRLQLLRHGPRT